MEELFGAILNSTVDEMIDVLQESGVIPTKKAFQEKYKQELEKIGKPIVVPVNPQEGCEELSCFTNVKKMIEKHGGESVCGYICWLGPRELYLYFEPHIVYKSPTGEIFDPTPQGDKEESLLFLAIDKKLDPEKRHPAIFIPICKEPEVLLFCKYSMEYYDWLSKNAIYNRKEDRFVWENNIEYQKVNSGRMFSNMLFMHYIRNLIEDNKNG